MPPKEGGKKGGKQLQALAQLNAVQSTYKAACRVHGVAPNKLLAAQIEEAIQQGGSIDKVSFTGPDTGAPALKASLEVLAAYPAVRNLTCHSCSLGDEGLEALATFIRSSADKWWKGSRLRLLEIVSDSLGRPLESWPATFMAHVSGTLPVRGLGHEQPNLLMDSSAETITATTLKMQATGMTAPSVFALEDEFMQAASSAAPVTSVMYRALRDARDAHDTYQYQRRAAGVIDKPLPLSVYQTRSDLTKKQTMSGTGISTGAGQVGSVSTGCGITVGEDLTARMARLAAMAGGGKADTAGTTGEADTANDAEQDAEEQDPLPALPGDPDTTTSQPPTTTATVTWQVATGQPYLPTPSTSAADTIASEALYTSSVRETLRLGLQDEGAGIREAPVYSRAAGPGFLAGLQEGSASLEPMTFSVPSLQSLSLALGAQGHGLRILVLDHNRLGDMGMHLLASGLKRCSTLTHLSLSNCGIGPAGASALCAVMAKDPDTLTHALQPKLLLLNASRNPLGGQGLELLCPGLTDCVTLKVLNLSSCGLTEDDVPALRTLAHTLETNPSIDNIDLEGNFFGDAGAAVFVPLLTLDPHVRKFRITARGMTRAGGGQIGALMKEHFPKKGGKKAGALKKK